MIENVYLYITGFGFSAAIVAFATVLLRYNKYRKLFFEVTDVLVAVRDAVEDDDITDKEIKEILDESKDLIDFFKR